MLKPTENTIAHAMQLITASAALGRQCVYTVGGYWHNDGSCEVTEQAVQAMGVTVAAGTLFDAGGTMPVAEAQADVSIDAADGTNDRYDLVFWDRSATAYAEVAGTPSANPTVPTLDNDQDVPLAIVHVQTGVSVITNADITDVRCMMWVGKADQFPIMQQVKASTTVIGNFDNSADDIVSVTANVGPSGNKILCLCTVEWSCAASQVSADFALIENVTTKLTTTDTVHAAGDKTTTTFIHVYDTSESGSTTVKVTGANVTDANVCTVESVCLLVIVLPDPA